MTCFDRWSINIIILNILPIDLWLESNQCQTSRRKAAFYSMQLKNVLETGNNCVGTPRIPSDQLIKYPREPSLRLTPREATHPTRSEPLFGRGRADVQERPSAREDALPPRHRDNFEDSILLWFIDLGNRKYTFILNEACMTPRSDIRLRPLSC